MPDPCSVNVSITYNGETVVPGGGAPVIPVNSITPSNEGAVGDGIADDTIAVQAAFTKASNEGRDCIIPKNAKYRITAPVFMWGQADLIGSEQRGWILPDFAVAAPFAINFGISGKKVMAEPFTGKVSEMAFKILNAPNLGRLLLPWRSDGMVVSHNYLDSDIHRYSLTSAQNHNDWVDEGNGQQYIRRDIIIEDNVVMARDTNAGGEGIGLGLFDGAVIRRNKVLGNGDDPIALHWCHNFEVYDNQVDSTDGRMFFSHCTNGYIHHNKATRAPSRLDKKFQVGIALIYVGFELQTIWVGPGSYAPTNIRIEDNDLYYPPGAKDNGYAIYLWAPRKVTVKRNRITNDAKGGLAQALSITPISGIPASAKWLDPDGLDPIDKANIHDVIVEDNVCDGAYPQKMVTTGSCSQYVGQVVFKGNTAKDHATDTSLIICPNNVKVVDPHDAPHIVPLPPPPPPPPPATEPSPNCTEGVEIVSNDLRRWTFSASGKVLINGVAPASNAGGQLYLFAGGTVYVKAGGLWYQHIPGPGDYFVTYGSGGTTKPPCTP